jgi:hypothetical protein
MYDRYDKDLTNQNYQRMMNIVLIVDIIITILSLSDHLMIWIIKVTYHHDVACRY